MSPTIHEVVHARAWRKCAPDWTSSTTEQKLDAFVHFCENYGHIRHPERAKIPFVLTDAQREIVRSWLENRYTISLKARQIGFSTVVSIYCFWLTYFYPDRKVIMLSRTEREAADLLIHAKYLYQFIPEWMRLLGPVCNWTQTKAVMTNNSSLVSMPSANDPARGSTAFTIVVDEIAFLNNSDQAWASIEPVVNIAGSCIMLSTANGEGNLFHKLWMGSQNGTNKFKGIFFPWSAAQGRDQAWYDVMVANTPEWQMAQEYPSDPESAFLKSGRPVFDNEKLRQLGVTEPDRGRIEDGEFIIDGGQLAVWELPRPDGVYVIGADVAEGLEHGDYSVAQVIEARSSRVVASWHGHTDPDLFGENVLAPLGHFYNTAVIGVENNNHGHTTIAALVRVKYRNQYRDRTVGEIGRVEKSSKLGWNTNMKSKRLAIDELHKALRELDLDLRDEHTVAELRTYVREGDGKMHGSPHDDRVMSLAIANQMLKYVWLPEYRSAKPKPGYGTWGRLLAHAYRHDEEKPKSKFIGAHAGRKAA